VGRSLRDSGDDDDGDGDDGDGDDGDGDDGDGDDGDGDGAVSPDDRVCASDVVVGGNSSVLGRFLPVDKAAVPPTPGTSCSRASINNASSPSVSVSSSPIIQDFSFRGIHPKRNWRPFGVLLSLSLSLHAHVFHAEVCITSIYRKGK